MDWSLSQNNRNNKINTKDFVGSLPLQDGGPSRLNANEKMGRQNSESLGMAIAWSIIGHILLVLGLTLKTFFIPDETIDFGSAVRVDIVLPPHKLPQKILPQDEQPPPVTAAPEPAKELKPVPVPNIEPVKTEKPVVNKTSESIDLNKVRDKQLEALRKLKSNEAFEKLKQMSASKNEPSALKKAASRPIEGEAIREGATLTGIDKLQHSDYISQLETHIKQYWALPEWLARKSLQASIQLRIDSRGLLLEKRIIKSSGQADFDDYALDAIVRANPLPPPPSKFSQLMESGGVTVHFP